MQITHIETIPLLVPIKPFLAIRSSQGVHNASPFLLVKAHTDAGIIGLGEASCTPLWSGEDHHTAAHFIETQLAPVLLGKDPRDISALTRQMETVLPGNPFTKSALQMALWDILGKSAGLPLYRLLGGKVREAVPLKFSISGQAPDKAAEIARWAVQQGFQAVKVKVGVEPEEDMARVRAVREAIGAQVRLGVDANGGWSKQEAIQMLRRLEAFDIFFAEQPVSPADMAWMAEVRRVAHVPLIADESVFSAQQAMAVAREGAADVFSLYVGKTGGIQGAQQMAAVAEAAGIACTVGSNLELGVASAAMIHFALSTPAVRAEAFPCDIIGPFYYDADILTEPLDIQNGRARIGERPGLGIALDEAVVAQFRSA
jgi:L-alanine-DL-glutamate epimerase-like enolase superfamily enzyme